MFLPYNENDVKQYICVVLKLPNMPGLLRNNFLFKSHLFVLASSAHAFTVFDRSYQSIELLKLAYKIGKARGCFFLSLVSAKHPSDTKVAG